MSVNVSVIHTICKTSVTHFSEYHVNVHHKVFKVVLSSLSVSTVSAPPVNVVKVTTTPTYQYTNPACKHAIVCKPVFSTSRVITTPAPAVATLIPPYLYMFVMYLCLQTYYVMFVKFPHPYLFLQTLPPHPDCMLSLKDFFIFTNN